MEKMLLSLKNIYKVLMTNDFPIYSESVISEKNRKGQTLLRFWQSQLADEFRCQPVGKMIWRNDGKRNRYISNLCNRSLEQKLCAEYAGELAQQITVWAMLNQIQRFMTFLSARAYRHDVLLRRIRELLRLCSIDDSRVSQQLMEHLLHTLPEPAGPQCQQETDNLFQAGYLLTVLTLYAAAGDAMDDPRLSVFQGEAYSMNQLWSQYRTNKSVHSDEIAFLSIHAGILQDAPLPLHRFFGREEELYDLREMAAANRKCLISGMGGVGKTELLRQLLRLCCEEKLADKMVVVPYELGIAESFLRAFPSYQRQAPEAGFQSILRMLERQAEEGFRVLVLVDNMNSSLEEDPALKKLLSLPCSVLITSRRTELPGFEIYSIRQPCVCTGMLIFRDNFETPLSQEDRGTLKTLLQNPAICHPLTLRLMARASVGNGWSVPQLAAYLRDGISGLTWTEGDQSVYLDRIYRQLYSQTMLSDGCREVAELFTLLPRDTYTRDFLERCFPCLADDLQQKLDVLKTGGWLEADISGYSMHPLIAQCLRRKVITEDRIAPLLQDLCRHLPEAALSDEAKQHDSETVRISEILICISEMLTGSISRELLLNVMKAIGLPVLTRETIERYKVHLDQLLKRCPQRDDLVEIRYFTIMGNWFFVEAAQIEPLYRRQKEKLTVSVRQFLDLCLANAPTLVYEKPALAVEMLNELFCGEATPAQKALAYSHMSAYFYHTGDTENAIHWSRQGVDYAAAHPECGRDLLFSNMAHLCMQYLRFQRNEEAVPLLDKLGQMLDKNSLPIQRSKYADMRALYALNTGRPEEALACYRENCQLIREYRGEDTNYFSTRVMMGRSLGALKRYGEAMEHLNAALAYFQENGDDYFHLIASINAAGLWLEQALPEQALECLEQAMPEARKQGGDILGVVLKNQAAAYRLLGDVPRESRSLREAVPLLEAAYGPEDPRARTLRQRLGELEDIHGSAADHE